MSRCYGFDTSAYLASKKSKGNSSVVGDALMIDSIKLQEARKNSFPDRVRERDEKKSKSSDRKRDRKRDNKEKKDRKDKKRDDKEKIRSVVENEKHKQKQKLSDEPIKLEGFGKDLIGKSRTEVVLERSNLTEEHGRPVDTQNVSCSSDSTGNSGKRKRVDTYSSPASSIQGNGNIIRIRLSSQKRDEPSKSQAELRPLPKSEPSICHAEGIPQVQEPPIHAASTSASTKHLVLGVDNLRPSHGKNVETLPPNDGPSTSGRVEESKELPSKKLSSHEKKMLKRESLYNKLFQNLVPPGLATELVADQVDDEDDWLFGKKDEENPAKKLRGVDFNNTTTHMDNLPCSTSTLLQPRAHFLSDVGVYALPFTVPF
ncbi:hypothetical protein vseg_000531 [Gypsophila vaccaria]